jgi:hypothetical protein
MRPDRARLMSCMAHTNPQFLNTPAKAFRGKISQSVHNGTELPPGSDYSLARKRTIADWLALGKTGVERAGDYRRSFDRSLVARVFCISHNRRVHSHRPRRGSDPARTAFHETRLTKRVRHGGN